MISRRIDVAWVFRLEMQQQNPPRVVIYPQPVYRRQPAPFTRESFTRCALIFFTIMFLLAGLIVTVVGYFGGLPRHQKTTGVSHVGRPGLQPRKIWRLVELLVQSSWVSVLCCCSCLFSIAASRRRTLLAKLFRDRLLPIWDQQPRVPPELDQPPLKIPGDPLPMNSRTGKHPHNHRQRDRSRVIPLHLWDIRLVQWDQHTHHQLTTRTVFSSIQFSLFIYFSTEKIRHEHIQ